MNQELDKNKQNKFDFIFEMKYMLKDSKMQKKFVKNIDKNKNYV